jgi:hypothetical protein
MSAKKNTAVALVPAVSNEDILARLVALESRSAPRTRAPRAVVEAAPVSEAARAVRESGFTGAARATLFIVLVEAAQRGETTHTDAELVALCKGASPVLAALPTFGVGRVRSDLRIIDARLNNGTHPTPERNARIGYVSTLVPGEGKGASLSIIFASKAPVAEKPKVARKPRKAKAMPAPVAEIAPEAQDDASQGE